MPEPVILIPGLMQDARVFGAQIAHLSRGRPVMVALPHPGATVEAMSAAVLAAAPAAFALAGLGLGGNVALDVVRRASDRVTRIALIATDPLSETPRASALREARLVTARAGRLPQAMRDEVPAMALADTPERAETQAILGDMAHAMGLDCYVAQSRAMQRRPDQQRVLRQSRIPMLFLIGADDAAMPPRRQDFAAGLAPFARLEVLSGAGQIPPLEAPAATSAALDRFLAGPLLLR